MKDNSESNFLGCLSQLSDLSSKSSKKKKRKQKRFSKVKTKYLTQRSLSATEGQEERMIDKRNMKMINNCKVVMSCSKIGHQASDRPNTAQSLHLPSINNLNSLTMSSSQIQHSVQRLATPSFRAEPSMPINVTVTTTERRKKVPLLSAIKPANEKSEKDRFIRANYQYNPFFLYKNPADDEVLERISNASDRLLPQAILIMENALERYGTYEEFESITGGPVLGRSQIYNAVVKYLKKEELESEVVINLTEELLSRGSMTRCKGKAQLNVRILNLREFWLDGLLRHEIGTHYLRSYNNRDQPWSNWKVRKELNMGPTNPTEEGLASLHSVLFRKDPCLWRSALLYYTVYKASQLSLKDLFKDLGRFVSDPNVRWDYCMRAKRGQMDTSKPGAFCKDQVYLEGVLNLLKKRRTIDFQMLIRMGKIDVKDVERLRPYVETEGTRIPSFMKDIGSYLQHLDRIVEMNGLTDEVLASV